jgi:hypothetical protein
MKIAFEGWIKQKPYSKDISALFDEAFTCYRNTAYRASLLFSYLGFLTIIKEVIIRSSKPLPISQSRWDHLIQKLQSDDTWEKAVYEELINSSSSIFNINEGIRQQIKYWKDRRNDCAHFKNNEIESHHTESFWSFIRSNILKITIEGGASNLLNKFEKHFDPTFTPPDADLSPLVREIDDTVDGTALSQFWSDLYSRIDLLGLSYYGETDFSQVVNQVFSNCNELVRDSLAKFLKENKQELYIVFLYPDKISQFNYDPSEIREIWRTRIWSFKAFTFPIYGILLRNSLIPLTELREAHEFIIARAIDSRPRDEATHLALAGSGFGEVIFKIAIQDQRLKDWFNWVNPRADMIAYYIEKYSLKEETVEVICEMYSRSNYSYWLAERISKIMEENPDKKVEFHQIANRKGFSIPSELN